MQGQKKISVLTLRKYKKEGRKAVMVTAYDYPQGQLASKAGMDAVLVGDSLGMTTLGYETTIPVTMEDMLIHARAVARGNKTSFLIGDMPFASYQICDEDAVRNASAFIQAGMDSVKLEGTQCDRVRAIADAGILVWSHLGLTPQTKAALGGYRIQGKTKSDADIILEDALRLQDAGCAFILLEAMPRESAGYIAAELEIPVYGIGAGDLTDGQLIIFHDLVGMFFEFKPKFAKRYCEAGQMIENALLEYAKEVRDGVFPSKEYCYEIEEDESEKILAATKKEHKNESC